MRAAGAAPLAMIFPSLALAFFIIGYPLWDLVSTSVHEVNRFGQVLGFTGAENYAQLLDDPLFMASLWRTLVWTVAVVIGSLALSVPIALILNDDFIGRGVARVIIMLPWAIVWRWTLNGQSGLLNVTLGQLGLIGRPVEWLATAELAFPIEIGVGILVSIPFTVTVLLGGLSSIPGDVYEAARIDGAGGQARFRYLTWPLLRPFINIAIVLNVIHVFNSFPIIWVLTGGGPANRTDILVTYLYKLAFRFGQIGKASAMSMVMFAALLAFIIFYVSMAMRERKQDQ